MLCAVLGFLQEVRLLSSSGQMKGEEPHRSAKSTRVGSKACGVSARCGSGSQAKSRGIGGAGRGAERCRRGLEVPV